MQGNSPKKDYDIDTVTDHEHAELRKKLSQYAVEIDNLRKENEAALEALNSAQAVAQQRVLERDSYFLTVEELEQSFQKLQEKYTQVKSIMRHFWATINLPHIFKKVARKTNSLDFHPSLA